MAVRKKAIRTTWSVAEAKSHLDEIMDELEAEGPQTVFKNGDKRALIVPMTEWGANRRRKGTLVEFLDNSPLTGLDIDFERHPDTQEREINL